MINTRKNTLVFGIILVLANLGFGQNKKLKNVLYTMDSTKIEEIKHNPYFQETIDKELMISVRNEESLMTKLLLELGANPHLPCGDCYGKDAMSIALDYKNKKAYYDLLPYYKFSNHKGEKSQNILFYAASNDIEVLQDVITRFNPPFELNNENENPLTFCWDKDTILSFPKIKLLTESYKLDTNHFNSQAFYDLNLLSFAVVNNDLEMVKWLVEKGADPFLYKKDIESIYTGYDFYFKGSAFHNSLSSSNEAFYNYFTSLLSADELEKELLFDFRIINEEGNEIGVSNAAMFLASNTNRTFLESFKDTEIDFNYYEQAYNNYTPIFEAMDVDNLVFIQFLLENRIWDKTYGKTALKWASGKDVNKEMKPMIKKYLKTNVFY